jgi:phage gp36-like protein
MFLTPDDYGPLINDNILAQIISNNQGVLLEAEQMAQAEMESYLSARFDTDQIFSQTDADRHKAVVMYLVDITLYHLHSRITPRNIPQLRTDRYNAALHWLNMVADGRLAPKLPLAKDDNNEVQDRLRWGSNDKFNHYF